MKNKYCQIFFYISFRFFKNCFFCLEQIVDDGVFDVSKTIEGNFGLTAFFGNNERSNCNLVQTEIFSKIVDIVASLKQIAD